MEEKGEGEMSSTHYQVIRQIKKSLNGNLTTVLGFASKAGDQCHMTPHHRDEGIKRYANSLGGKTASKTLTILCN